MLYFHESFAGALLTDSVGISCYCEAFTLLLCSLSLFYRLFSRDVTYFEIVGQS